WMGTNAMIQTRSPLSRFLSDYSMVLVLLGLCAYYSYATLAEQHPGGAAGGEQLADDVLRKAGPNGKVLIVVRNTRADTEFADALRSRLAEAGLTNVETVHGHPADARRTLQRLAKTRKKIDVIAGPQATASWAVLHDVGRKFPGLGDVAVLSPRGYLWPNFL